MAVGYHYAALIHPTTQCSPGLVAAVTVASVARKSSHMHEHSSSGNSDIVTIAHELYSILLLPDPSYSGLGKVLVGLHKTSTSWPDIRILLRVLYLLIAGAL